MESPTIRAMVLFQAVWDVLQRSCSVFGDADDGQLFDRFETISIDESLVLKR